MKLTAERNAPCPCGSGRKYKKCCGLNTNAPTPDFLRLNREVAYRGSLGRRREAFCISYTKYMGEQRTLVTARLQKQLASQGKSITCGRGCAACCHLYVIASVQECEAIVYYLYQHEETLQHFLLSFNRWREQVRGIWNDFQEINRLEDKRLSSNLNEAEEEAFGAALFSYRSQNIACPFLKEGACSIYDVRPFVCSGLIATTPPEWCSPLHPRYDQSNYLTDEPDKDSYLPYFANPDRKPCLSCLPVGVYEILYNSWSFLWTLPGCEWMERELKSDEEIQSAIASFRK
jgi:Fe-S-cluster containining protein